MRNMLVYGNGRGQTLLVVSRRSRSGSDGAIKKLKRFRARPGPPDELDRQERDTKRYAEHQENVTKGRLGPAEHMSVNLKNSDLADVGDE
jgi:hypothetical protein